MSWPASFATGPLGASNILPTGPGAFLGAMHGGIGYSETQRRTLIAARQVAMGRSYDFLQAHYDGGGTYGGVFGCEDPTDILGAAPGGITTEAYAIANGSYPVVAWTPNYTIADINAGTADTILQKLGLYWSQYAPARVMLRIMWEFDLNGFTWSIYGQGGGSIIYSSAQFISAWQRIVAQVQAGGGTNVGFWWVPFEGGMAGGTTGRQTEADYYPGDAYVDWVGTDIYTGPFQSSPLHAGYAQWWEDVNYSVAGSGQTALWSVYDLFSSGLAVSGQRGFTGTPRVKPFVVGENSATYVVATPAAKHDYWVNVTAATHGIGSMAHCVGCSFFDQDVHSASDYNWQIDSNAAVVNTAGTPDATTLAGFVTMANTTAFQGIASGDSANLTLTDALAAAGFNSTSSVASVHEVATIHAAGFRTISGAAAVAEIVTIHATGIEQYVGAAALTETATITATGFVGTNPTGAVSLAMTLHEAAAGFASKTGAAARAETVTITVSGASSKTGAVSLSLSCARTAAGFQGKAAQAHLALVAAVAVNGVVTRTTGAASLVETVTITAAGSGGSLNPIVPGDVVLVPAAGGLLTLVPAAGGPLVLAGSSRGSLTLTPAGAGSLPPLEED